MDNLHPLSIVSLTEEYRSLYLYSLQAIVAFKVASMTFKCTAEGKYVRIVKSIQDLMPAYIQLAIRPKQLGRQLSSSFICKTAP